MSDIIDFNEKRNERERPDADLICKDDFGRPMYTFGVEYEMDGAQWTFHLWAYSFEDAEKRVGSIRESGKVYGQIHTIIPA